MQILHFFINLSSDISSISKNKKTFKLLLKLKSKLAGQVGVEPTTIPLTAEGSAIELLTNKTPIVSVGTIGKALVILGTYT